MRSEPAIIIVICIFRMTWKVLRILLVLISTLLPRLPSLEQKMRDADEILTRTEDEIDKMDSGTINPEDLQFQVTIMFFDKEKKI
jgi:hypothetical protein